jgi:hypothetical protein
MEKSIDSITLEDILEWQYSLVHTEKVSWSHFNQMVCALRFYFQKVRGVDWPVVDSRFIFFPIPVLLSSEYAVKFNKNSQYLCA